MEGFFNIFVIVLISEFDLIATYIFNLTFGNVNISIIFWVFQTLYQKSCLIYYFTIKRWKCGTGRSSRIRFCLGEQWTYNNLKWITCLANLHYIYYNSRHKIEWIWVTTNTILLGRFMMKDKNKVICNQNGVKFIECLDVIGLSLIRVILE